MKTRRNYTPIRIDFTPFVSIALLLIVFFVCLKTVQRPNQMRLELPDDRGCYESLPSADASLFLLANNRIGILTYRPDGSGAEFIETNYSVNGLRKQLMYLMLDKQSIILIMPTAQSTFKNIVDVLDELNILGKIRFRLNYEITTGEKQMIDRYEQYRATCPKNSAFMFLPLYLERTIDFYRNISQKK